MKLKLTRPLVFFDLDPRTMEFLVQQRNVETVGVESGDVTALQQLRQRGCHLPESRLWELDGLSEFANPNRNVDLLGRLIYDDNKREVINFGKYKGRLAEEVLASDPGYYAITWTSAPAFTNSRSNTTLL